jgi:ankyrin repeat protein
LFIAADLDEVPLAELLIEQGADVHEKVLISEWTALHAAAQNASLRMINVLLTAGADPNARDGLARTPLHLAAFAAKPLAVGRLITAGADPKALDSLGNSPLHYAAMAGSSATVRALVEAGSPQTPNVKGQTPFDIAVEGGFRPLQSLLTPTAAQKAMDSTNRELNRRNFLKAGAVAAAGAALLGPAPHAKAAPANKVITFPAGIPTRPFGKTGHVLPVLGHGGSAMVNSWG